MAGVLLLHEKETWHGLTGTVLIACGAVGANLFKPKAKPSSGGDAISQVSLLLFFNFMTTSPSRVLLCTFNMRGVRQSCKQAETACKQSSAQATVDFPDALLKCGVHSQKKRSVS